MTDPKRSRAPKLAINRVYTRGGDGGQTALIGGERVDKDAPRIEVYGTVDELNSFVGAALITAREAPGDHASLRRLAALLRRVQHELFNLGSILATRPAKVAENQPRVGEAEIAHLETMIDEMNQSLPPLRSFVLPGGSRLSVELHQCRTICRRAERRCVALSHLEDVDAASISYLNRLSDAFFVWSRFADDAQGVPETLWDPNGAKDSD